MFKLSSYDYCLPDEYIAQSPASPPESAKCLYWNGSTYLDRNVSDLLNLLDPKTLLIFNNTKVINARIPLLNTSRIKSNGKNEIILKGEIFFLEQVKQNQFEALVNPGKKFQIGDIIIQDNRHMKVIAITEHGRILESSSNIYDILGSHGEIPLPPYIKHNKDVYNRYQSIMAELDGSVAAPTASLHFTPSLIEQLTQNGHLISNITLHIGLGTFKTVSKEDISQHAIHTEHIIIPNGLWEEIANKNKNSILAVGTTVARSLESMPYIRKIIKNNFSIKIKQQETILFRDKVCKDISLDDAQEFISNIEINDNNITCRSKLFLYPGKDFLVTDQLITNFHLPKSSLLMLVAAFIGYENMIKCYQHAIQEQYRFFSFGDCMFLGKKTTCFQS